MSVVEHPLGGLIEGMLQGHALAQQLHRQMQEDQAFKTNQALRHEQLTMQQIMNEEADRKSAIDFQQSGRAVTNGMVTSPAVENPDPGVPGAGKPAGLPSYTRKADASRVVSDRNGNKIEIYTPEEQQQRTLDSQISGMDRLEQAKITAQQNAIATARKNQLAMENGGTAAVGLESIGVPAGTMLTRAEFEAGKEHALKLAKEQQGLDQGVDAGRKTKLEADELERKLNLLKNADPNDGLKLLDQIVPPDVKGNAQLNMRAKAQYSAAVKRGDMTGAQDVIKQVAGEVRALEIATDPRVQAAKINVSVGSQTAKDNARTPSQAAVDLMAEDALNGKAPSSRNQVLYAHVMERAADLAKERGLTNQQVIMQRNAAGAYKGALNTMTKNAESVEAFSKLADKNIGLLEAEMKKIPDTGAKFLNTPVRGLVGQFGSGMAGFTAAILPVQAEIARVLNSANASGVLTNEARKEMETAIGPNMTVAGLKSALKVFQSEMANRRETYGAAVKDLQERSVAGGVPATTPAAAAGQAAGGAHTIEVNGKHYTYKGSGATDDLKNYTEVTK